MSHLNAYFVGSTIVGLLQFYEAASSLHDPDPIALPPFSWVGLIWLLVSVTEAVYLGNKHNRCFVPVSYIAYYLLSWGILGYRLLTTIDAASSLTSSFVWRAGSMIFPLYFTAISLLFLVIAKKGAAAEEGNAPSA